MAWHNYSQPIGGWIDVTFDTELPEVYFGRQRGWRPGTARGRGSYCSPQEG